MIDNVKKKMDEIMGKPSRSSRFDPAPVSPGNFFIDIKVFWISSFAIVRTMVK